MAKPLNPKLEAAKPLLANHTNKEIAALVGVRVHEIANLRYRRRVQLGLVKSKEFAVSFMSCKVDRKKCYPCNIDKSQQSFCSMHSNCANSQNCECEKR